MNNTVEIHNLGTLQYNDALQIQLKLREDRLNNKIPDSIILLEHSPVFTLGKRRIEEDFILSKEEIIKKGIDIVETNRGGRVTYHGPGQLMTYFIFNIESIGVKTFVKKLEELSLNFLNKYGINAKTDDEHPGVWVDNSKIVAIGLNVDHFVTMHGMAINVNCDLTPYNYIIACGINDRLITTIEKIKQNKTSVDIAKEYFIRSVKDFFGCEIKTSNRFV